MIARMPAGNAGVTGGRPINNPMNASETAVSAPPAPPPLVSVVTPFYNIAPYLAECIESVLAQSYTNFEYILVDNCSTDGSTKIAEGYARRDPRIRFIRRSQLLSQGDNYNRALAEISESSQLCKIVQADDLIYPDCLRLMVEACERCETIGLVSSYRLYGDAVEGSGYPHATVVLKGRDCARWFLQTLNNIFGSETTVMYRSAVVRQYQPFYKTSIPHADLERCMEILKNWDFAFVPQVLSFSRTDNESITGGLLEFIPYALDRYVVVRRFAPVFLAPAEGAARIKKVKQQYYRVLATEAIRLRRGHFWYYHQNGLREVNETIDWLYLALQIGVLVLWKASNPGMAVRNVLRFARRRRISRSKNEATTKAAFSAPR
jgi:glycosyltransferase involved in cell wall biosynthesis